MSPYAEQASPQQSLCPFSNSAATAMEVSSGCPWLAAQQLHPVASRPSNNCSHDDSAAHLPEQQSSDDDNCSETNSESSESNISVDSGTSRYVHQAWQLKKPVLTHDPKLTRRQLRQLDRQWSLADVAQHKYCDDGWIAVDGKVYDITEHITSHPGWDSGCRVTEVLSIIAHLGCDCSQEFHEIHRSYPVSYKQLAAYYIGDLQR